MPKVRVKSLDIRWNVRGEGFLPIKIDAEKRRWG